MRYEPEVWNEDERPGRFRLVELPIVLAVVAVGLALLMTAIPRNRAGAAAVLGQWNLSHEAPYLLHRIAIEERS